VDSTLNFRCPKCAAEMEPIEIAVEGLPIEQVRLCPDCYLVEWSDAKGSHIEQGIPVPKDHLPGGVKRGES
jgi:hypothetical protein